MSAAITPKSSFNPQRDLPRNTVPCAASATLEVRVGSLVLHSDVVAGSCEHVNGYLEAVRNRSFLQHLMNVNVSAKYGSLASDEQYLSVTKAVSHLSYKIQEANGQQ